MAIGYTMDVYSDEIKAEKNISKAVEFVIEKFERMI